MSEVLSIYVVGKPVAQGSKKHVGNGVMVEMGKGLASWRKTIAAQAGIAWTLPPLDGAVGVRLTFVMPRPKATPKSRTPPAIRRPDLDKLSRAVLDSLTTGRVMTDDSRVVDLHAQKVIAPRDWSPGVAITVYDLS